jgi:glutamate-1-semialdehyde 2,1-aminomutase
MRRDKSRAAFARATKVMPGGVNSPARAFGAVGGEPLFIERGHGAYVYDVDGNRYVDYVSSWGPLILGHAHPRVTRAVADALHRGTSFGAPTEAESELAELIVEAVPSVEMVRLVNSGTEATMSAIRLARAQTGRRLIVKFAGNYHGHVDSLLVAAGSSATTLAAPDSPGVTTGTTQDTLVLTYGDVDGLAATMAAHGPQIAGIIFEPVAGNMGVVRPPAPFLLALRELTRRYGSLLICDEVMTGFRVAYGGAQQRFGIEPDLTTLGKVVGGGLPMGAYGGRAAIMAQVLPAGRMFQAGTLSGNPLATAAGIATLRALRDQPPYDRLEMLGGTLEAGLHDAATAAGIPHTVARVGSMLTLFFSPDPVTDWESARRCDTARFADYFWGLVQRDIMVPCSQYEALFISAAHSDEDIAATIDAARAALEETG